MSNKIHSEEFSFIDHTGYEVNAFKIMPVKPRAILQLSHGMMEHSGRYKDMAGWFAKQGVAVFCSDHRGHGKNVKNPEDLGYFADDNGWDLVVDNLHSISDLARKELAGLPFFLLGHSMGSIVARTYTIKFGKELDGLILAGTTQQDTMMMRFGIVFSSLIKALKGSRYSSSLSKKLGHGQYIKQMKLESARTEFDWMTQDEQVMDAFLADPLCGKTPPAGFYIDFCRGMLFVKNMKNLKNIPDDLPVLIFGGDRDPVGRFGKDLEKVKQDYEKAGLKNVHLKLYQGYRHEMHHEPNKIEVFEDVLSWMNQIIMDHQKKDKV